MGHVFLIQFILGAILIYYGAEYLVKASTQIASYFNISSMVVGITIVALGTSLPELVVSIIANINDEQGMVVGNVFGSNIANIGLVLGLVSIIKPITNKFKEVATDLYFLLFITTLSIFFIYWGDLLFWQGLFLIFILIIYSLNLVYRNKINDDNIEKDKKNIFVAILKLLIGIFGLSFGSHYFVKGASGIANFLGVSSLVIGMSIVALGTSLPELATSLVAAKRNKADFIIGNIIGSNIYNILAVLGISIMVRPIRINFEEIFFHSNILLFFTLILFYLIKNYSSISKLVGILLLSIYTTFIYFNFL